MPVISIVGTSGVGKSFLVKQLASLDCAPAFFEGEEGVIPKRIFDNILSKKSPVIRFTWFINRYKKTLDRAKKISDSGVTCYVDGGYMTARAVLMYEDQKYHHQLFSIINSIAHLRSDMTLLLTANPGKLMELFTLRNRTHENLRESVQRALHIQKEFILLGKQEKNTLIIDRSELDFAKEKDLRYLLRKIKRAI